MMQPQLIEVPRERVLPALCGTRGACAAAGPVRERVLRGARVLVETARAMEPERAERWARVLRWLERQTLAEWWLSVRDWSALRVLEAGE